MRGPGGAGVGPRNVPTEKPAQLPSKHPMASIPGSLPLRGKKSPGNKQFCGVLGGWEAAAGPVPLAEQRGGVCVGRFGVRGVTLLY